METQTPQSIGEIHVLAMDRHAHGIELADATLSQLPVKLRVLFVEDDPSDIELISRALQRGGFAPECDIADKAQSFTAHIQLKAYDIVLADFKLPSWNGLETLKILRQEHLDVPVVLVSGALGETRAVECIKQGAADYVLKDQLLRLPNAVRRAVREKHLRDQNRQAQAELARSNRELEQFAYVASHDLRFFICKPRSRIDR